MLFFLLLFASISLAQKQPDSLKDLCQLTGHSATTLGNTVYTLGGTARYKVSGKDAFPNATMLPGNQPVITVPNKFLRIIPLTSNATGESIPLPSDLISNLDPTPPLWTHDGSIYVSASNNTEIWVYNPKDTKWSQVPSIQGTGPTRGTGAWSPALNNDTSLYALSASGDGLDSFNNPSAEWSRAPGPGSTPGSLLVHIPALDVLVSLLPSTSNISIYSLATNKWYTQNTTDPPSEMTTACAVVASAPNSTSHNVYIFSSKTLYALSLPSFTWTRVGDTNFGLKNMACAKAGERSMVVYQGSANRKECRGRGVEMLDLSTLVWGNDMKDGGKYEVPKVLRDLPTTPEGGFSDPNLEALFNVTTPTTSSSTSSSAKSPSKSPDSTSASPELPVPTKVAIGLASALALGLFIVLIRFLHNRAGRKTPRKRKTFVQEMDAGHHSFWGVWGLHGADRRSQAPDVWMLRWLTTERWRTQEGVAELQGDDMTRI
ncbi:hypothetical protein EDC01DRAFT_392329 [Geopyxis carbonaria]|nr:hypothetical protein EDC01DRAFT_392329 [Geopyxis carbonaria]